MEMLHFCRDGVLRRRFARYDPTTSRHDVDLIPLQAYIEVVDKHAFLKELHAPIAFEDGLTVGEMMENLAPWQDLMIGCGVLDFPAFLEELRHEPVNPVDEVDAVVLRYSATLKAVPEFEEPAPGEFVGAVKVSGAITLEQGWDMETALSAAGVKEYGAGLNLAIDHVPICEWKHLPITIAQWGTFRDDTASSTDQEYLGVQRAITDATHPFNTKIVSRHGVVSAHSMTIAAPGPTFFDTLIRGFMWNVGFAFSPAQRDREIEEMEAVFEKQSGSDGTSSEQDHTARYEAEFLRRSDHLKQIKKASHGLGLTCKALDL